MTFRNLDKLFNPKRIAVVGASDVPGKVGHILLHSQDWFSRVFGGFHDGGGRCAGVGHGLP